MNFKYLFHKKNKFPSARKIHLYEFDQIYINGKKMEIYLEDSVNIVESVSTKNSVYFYIERVDVLSDLFDKLDSNNEIQISYGSNMDDDRISIRSLKKLLFPKNIQSLNISIDYFGIDNIIFKRDFIRVFKNISSSFILHKNKLIEIPYELRDTYNFIDLYIEKDLGIIYQVNVNKGDLYHPNCEHVNGGFCLGNIKYQTITKDVLDTLCFSISIYNTIDCYKIPEKIKDIIEKHGDS